MSEPGGTSLMQNSLRDQAAHELYNSPKADNYQGWDPYDLNEKAEKNYRMNSLPWGKGADTPPEHRR